MKDKKKINIYQQAGKIGGKLQKARPWLFVAGLIVVKETGALGKGMELAKKGVDAVKNFKIIKS